MMNKDNMNDIDLLCAGCKKAIDMSMGPTESKLLICCWCVVEEDTCPCSQCLIKSICVDPCEKVKDIIEELNCLTTKHFNTKCP